jgi:hypothetical protein
MYLIPPFLLYWNLGEMNVVSERCGVVQFLFFFLGKKKREKKKKKEKSTLPWLEGDMVGPNAQRHQWVGDTFYKLFIVLSII